MIATEAAKVKTGRQRADRELTIHEIEHQQFMLRMQRTLTEIVLTGDTVTVDDLRKHVTIPASVPGVALGAIPKALVSAGAIRRAGFVESSRPEAHARPVSVWALNDAAAARRWLAEHPAPVPVIPPTVQRELFASNGEAS